MPKNTLLFVSFLAVIAALLIGINIGRSMAPQSALSTPTPTPKITATPTVAMILGSTCGITFEYPSTLTAMESSGSGMILANTTKPEESIVVVCQDEIPRVALTPDKIEPRKILSATGNASASAKLYHDTQEKDGTPVDKLIFTHPTTKQDIFIAGFGAIFNQIISTLKLQ